MNESNEVSAALRGRKALTVALPCPACYEGGEMVSVHCPLCATKLRGMVPREGMREARTEGNRTVIYERLIMTTLPAYTEVTFTFDDGSAHVVALCATCAGALTLTEAEAVYVADLEWMAASGPLRMQWVTRNLTGFRL